MCRIRNICMRPCVICIIIYFVGMEPKEPNQGEMQEINLKPLPNHEVSFND